jgi:murein DD-endopeptidase MepM/ murein hydrolase activator NlpD
LGDTDYLNEAGSIQSVLATSRTRDFEVITYVVQKGDTINSIAEQFGVSTDTIRWENNISGDYLKIGQELRILPMNGVIHVVAAGDTIDKIAAKYQASKQDIFDINWLESESLKVGQKLLVPDGRKPQPKPIAKPIVAVTPIIQPGVDVVGSGSFVRPCACGSVTNSFSNWHGGVDIASTPGCTIVAADRGTVTMARWAGNGGLQIMINHGNGFVTLYAHNSALYVSEGQTVERGQPIGFMGRTGHATGIHLHFGLFYNNVCINPRSYVPI